jgi:hypothetical protein
MGWRTPNPGCSQSSVATANEVPVFQKSFVKSSLIVDETKMLGGKHD